ncbi:MAG: hypothetical protein BWY83_02753 [bacterium ADurb.Bin478]|nr:MAG: hypothetical protein BWY83_02753 [bacterium ADurb.Bin478]
MKIKKSSITLVLFCLLVLSGCRGVDADKDTFNEWATYLLADPSLTSYQIRETPLADLQPAPTPFITIGDLRAYHWKTHQMEFTPEMEAALDTLTIKKGTVYGLPFVVMVGDERIYAGAFWWAYSSLTPSCPYIQLISPKPLKISLPPLHQGADPRTDERVYWALMAAGLLKE